MKNKTALVELFMKKDEGDPAYIDQTMLRIKTVKMFIVGIGGFTDTSS
jgi:hypothetical protein